MLAQLLTIRLGVQFDCLFVKILSCSKDKKVFLVYKFFLNSESVLKMKIYCLYSFNFRIVLLIVSLILYETKF